jgi:hypothetical protein
MMGVQFIHPSHLIRNDTGLLFEKQAGIHPAALAVTPMVKIAHLLSPIT